MRLVRERHWLGSGPQNSFSACAEGGGWAKPTLNAYDWRFDWSINQEGGHNSVFDLLRGERWPGAVGRAGRRSVAGLRAARGSTAQAPLPADAPG